MKNEPIKIRNYRGEIVREITQEEFMNMLLERLLKWKAGKKS